MKIKFLSIAFAFVLALALASCGGTPKPSGDPVKDAKAYVDKYVSLAEGVSSPEDAKKADETVKEMNKSFKEAYKDKPEEYAKFQAEKAKLLADPQIMEKLSKAKKAAKGGDSEE